MKVIVADVRLIDSAMDSISNAFLALKCQKGANSCEECRNYEVCRNLGDAQRSLNQIFDTGRGYKL